MIGRTVSHYSIESELGAGGMGVVYKAKDVRLGRTVALKFLPPELTRDPHAKERFIREAKSASSLDHPNICTIYDFDETDDHQLFFAMPCYAGETLQAKLVRGRLPISKAVEIATQIAGGLSRAHQMGIIHRDIKPANIMMTADGQIKILDFGLAKLVGDQTLTKAGSAVGSPPYMSPEQIRGEEVDHRTDIWSLGVVLYEMLRGTPPFRGGSTAAIFHTILQGNFDSLEADTAIETVLQRSLAKSVADRYSGLEQMIRDLEAVPASSAITSLATADRRAEEPLPSIAVLPFADMSAGRDQEYFCEGIAEEILNSLTQIDGLRVASRTSSFHYKGSDKDVRQIGERLRVRTILEGSVRKAGDRLRVTVQLIDVADGYHLWSQRYDSELKDVFEIQDEIAQNTARALEPLLQPGHASVRKAPRTGLEAYDLYLRGRKLFDIRQRSLVLAREMFERSAACDPNYALAYTGIADCSSWLFMWFRGDPHDLERAQDASRRALELSPGLAEVHVSRGFSLSLGRNYDDAADEFEKAIQLNANLFDPWYLYGRMRFLQNRPQDALPLLHKASQVQPDDYQGLAIASMAEIKLGQTQAARTSSEEGLRRIERRLLIDPNDARALYLGAILMMRAGGDRVRGEELMRRSLAVDPDDAIALYTGACFYSLAGDTDRAVALLEKAAASGRRGFFADWMGHDPDLDPVRHDPRFQSLLLRLR
jgi:serine/threonine protein kinase/tetratricopeptide (TPR) repeat protein